MNAILKPDLCGTRIPHKPDFTIDRPRDPHGTNLIFSFRSPGIIYTKNGLETAAAGDCMIHSVNFYQYHTGIPGAEKGYENDFLHVSPSAVAPLMRKLGLPYDTLLHTACPDILTPFIIELQAELLAEDAYTEKILLNLLERMFLNIARGRRILEKNRAVISSAERRYFQDFCRLREEILRDFRKDFTLTALARKVHLSPERFAVLYKKFFDATPYNELIEARIAHARRLLTASSLEVKEIASLCSWKDVHYFARIFRRKTGLTPSGFRSGTNRKEESSSSSTVRRKTGRTVF
ncbi:MAG: Arabinose operon regulatory protein [Lentisphaerae bacterium ADurb.Bin242]|nr:MAG: Arabinose operon regulatory protein [Lentisphaerae bacterium ADurb.Bin242]